jgi:hypothetical protein
MSGQRPQNLNPGVVYNTAPATSAAATAAVNPAQIAAPRVPQSVGVGAIGAALSGFFGGAANLAAGMQALEHSEKLDDIRKENEALALQGSDDRLKGKPVNETAAGRTSYVEAYAKTNATVLSRELGDKFRAEVASKPLDGSFDIDAYRQEFIKREVGSGSGDPMFDVPLLSQLNSQIEPVTDWFKAESLKTTQANSLVSLNAEIEGYLQQTGGVSADQMQNLVVRATSLFQGDTGSAQKWITATLTGHARNPGQVESVLKALNTPQVDGRSFAERQPQVYAEVSGRLYGKLNSLKTYEAVQAHDNFLSTAMDELRRSPTLETAMSLVSRYDEAIWDRYGGIDERRQFHAQVEATVGRLVEQKVQSNAVLRHLVGVGRIDADSTALGKGTQAVIDEGFDRAVQQLAESRGVPLAVTQTEFGYGAVDPLGDDNTASFVGAAIERLDGVSANAKAAINNGIVNLNDPARASRAYSLIARVYNSRGEVGGPAAVDRLLTEQSKTFFYAIRSAAEAGVAPQAFIETTKNQPEVLRALGEARQGSSIDWPILMGSSKKAGELQAEIDQSAAKHLGKLTGWFGDDVVFGSSKMAEEFRAEVALQLAYQRSRTSSPDIDSATKAAAGKFASKFMLVPGFDGTVTAFPNVFGRSGEVGRSPSGEAILAPLPVKNPVTGEVEEPGETWKSDLAALSTVLPGLVGEDRRRVHLRPASDTASSGLFTVYRGDGRPLVFAQDQEIAVGADDKKIALPDNSAMRGGGFGAVVPGKREIVKLPADYAEAEKALRGILPRGFYLEDLGLQDGVRAFGVRYGFRYATDPSTAAAEAEARTMNKRQNVPKSRARLGFGDGPFPAP